MSFGNNLMICFTTLASHHISGILDQFDCFDKHLSRAFLHAAFGILIYPSRCWMKRITGQGLVAWSDFFL
jgi:hypothetical protein